MKKNIKEQIFRSYFWYQALSFLIKDLFENNQIKNNTIAKHLNESSINLRNSVDSK